MSLHDWLSVIPLITALLTTGAVMISILGVIVHSIQDGEFNPVALLIGPVLCFVGWIAVNLLLALAVGITALWQWALP